MKIVAMIIARGGSKGVPRKNLADIGGKSMIHRAIEAAQESHLVDRVFFSTDDQEILDSAVALGMDGAYRRPAELAADDTPAIDVVLHGLDWMADHWNYVPNILVLLQPTCPLRTAEDVDACIQLYLDSDCDSVTSVHEMSEHPFECVAMEDGSWSFLAKPDATCTRRQDYGKKFYFINGAVYVNSVDFLRENRCFIQEGKTKLHVMPAQRGVDIDTELDLNIACALADCLDS